QRNHAWNGFSRPSETVIDPSIHDGSSINAIYLNGRLRNTSRSQLRNRYSAYDNSLSVMQSLATSHSELEFRFLEIGHSFFAICFAAIGGFAGLYLGGRRGHAL